ncbi:leucine-rich repeat domain-containing protein [Turneriella parva]|uniref:Leucine-rich repeat-containing protein n=1 Tax=Turneriella parva (strain ATCC BAA-1111 / DSM 21527 / NCTC 11395 / H) TaxID=869212 RepID=I4B679_TURPD|nr:leucine-rich repeat domain-containing protein [Turneriella parva]AFM12786.1 leucine-rich repeat-containing protein [Turneriella parva DSM 21527]
MKKQKQKPEQSTSVRLRAFVPGLYSMLADYGPDLVFMALLAFLTPWLHARVSLPEIFPMTGRVFRYTTVILAGVEVILLYFYVRMAMHRQHMYNSELPFPAVISFLRIFSIFPVAMPLINEAEILCLIVIAFWILGHLAYANIFIGGVITRKLDAPSWLYRLVQVILFASMFCMATSSYIFMHDMGGLTWQHLTERPFDIWPFLLLVSMLYLPTRLFEFIQESMVDRDGRQFLFHTLRLFVIWLLLVAEIGTLDPKVLDTALEHAKNPEVVTKLDLANSDLTHLKEIARFTELRTLNLRANQLTQFPEEILGIENLRELTLTDNLIRRVPQDIGKLKNLESLALNSNKFTVFPHEILELPNLKILYLSENQLRELPAQIVRLKRLQKLIIGENQLQSLPLELLELPLREVNAEKNEFAYLDPKFRKKFSQRQGWYW